jgi:DNA-binding CsgD family transcriptional regulator
MMRLDEAIRQLKIEGRTLELGRLEQFLDAVPSGSRSLVLDGQAGIGKSVLWADVVRQSRARGWHTLTCRPAEFESDLVFAALGDLVRPVAATADELPSVPRRALMSALLLDEPIAEGADQLAIAQAVLLLLGTLARDAPVLIAIDDLQWIDRSSSRILQFVVRRLGDEPVGFIATMRDDDRTSIFARRSTTPDRLEIGPLDRDATGELLRARIAAPIRRSTLRQIFEKSGGNPLFALELARAWSREHSDPDVPVALPTSLRQLMEQRLDQLPRRTRDALAYVAVLPGQRFEVLQSALSAAGLDTSALDAAFENDVLTRSERGVRFEHPLLNSVAYWGVTETRRRDAHRCAGSVLGDTPAGIHHLAMVTGGADERLAGALEQTAGEVARRGAPDAAATLLAEALRLTPTTALHDRARRAVACADRHLDSGATDEAASVLRTLPREEMIGVDRARLLHGLSRVVGRIEGFRPSGELLREALDHTGHDVGLRSAIERDLANTMSNHGDVRGALGYAELAVQHARTFANAELLRSTQVNLAVTRLFLGLGAPDDVEHQANVALERLGVGAHVNVNAQLLDAMTWAAMLKWTDRFDLARAILDRLVELLEERDEEGLAVPVLFQLGELACWSGDLEVASKLATSCAQTAIATQQSAWIVVGLHLRALVDAVRGSVVTARASVEEGLRRARELDEARMLIRLYHVAGMTELYGPDPGGAADWLLDAVELAERCGYGEPGVFRIDADAIEALLAAGRTTEAEVRTAALESVGRMLERPYAIATAARCRSLLALAHGDPDEALGLAVRANALARRLPQPIERARTLLVQGTIERRLHRRAAARVTLKSAEALFADVGATGWAGAAQRELARIGGRTASPDELTPTEEAVAELVASGNRNREVARRLHMSEKTVEANLTRIYRKLGVRSRSELAARRA